MIEVSHLTKRYGINTALDDVSFVVEGSGVVGFLGPNGAGKSTTMNIITGYLSASSGSVKVEGHDVLEEPDEVKRRIGYLPEQPPLYLDMTVEEYLQFIFDLKKVKKDKKQHIAQVCRRTGIDGVYHRLIGNLSKGYRQRVGLAQALLGDPPLLILDEPTVGLDPKQIIEIRNLIKMLGKSHTVILSSHILQEIEATCERILIVNQGKLVADGTQEQLAKTVEPERLAVSIEAPRAQAEKALAALPQVADLSCLGEEEEGVWKFSLREASDARRAIYHLCRDQEWDLLAMSERRNTLEDIFLRLTSGAPVAVDAPKGGAQQPRRAVAEVVGYQVPPTDRERGKPAQAEKAASVESEKAQKPEGGEQA